MTPERPRGVTDRCIGGHRHRWEYFGADGVASVRRCDACGLVVAMVVR